LRAGGVMRRGVFFFYLAMTLIGLGYFIAVGLLRL
jgi:hypothetical protein